MFDIITEVFVTLCCLLDNVCGMGSFLEKNLLSWLRKFIGMMSVCEEMFILWLKRYQIQYRKGA